MNRAFLFLGFLLVIVLLGVIILTWGFSASGDGWYSRGIKNKEQKEKRIYELQGEGYSYDEALYKWNLEEGEERVRELQDQEYHKFGNEDASGIGK